MIVVACIDAVFHCGMIWTLISVIFMCSGNHAGHCCHADAYCQGISAS